MIYKGKNNNIDILSMKHCEFLSYVVLNQQRRHLLSHYSNVSENNNLF